MRAVINFTAFIFIYFNPFNFVLRNGINKMFCLLKYLYVYLH